MSLVDSIIVIAETFASIIGVLFVVGVIAYAIERLVGSDR
jgi:flagellar biogenesis protein FliO